MKYTLYIIYMTVAMTVALQSCKPDKPTAAERRAEFQQSLKDQLQTERQTLHVTDSLLSALSAEINTAVTNGFEYEKTEYDDLGRFKPAGMDPGENVQRTYLRSAVDDYGRTQLICTYCGPKSFVVTQLRAESSDGTSLLTQHIQPNDGSNYSYDIDGVHYQSVTFAYAGRITEGMTSDSTILANADTDNGMLAYLASQLEAPSVKCTMIGQNGQEKSVVLDAETRRKLAATYELGVLLRESVRLQQENKTAALKIQYLESKVSE